MQQLVRALTDYIEQMSNPGPVVCSTLRILQVPRSGGRLPIGSVWSNSGVLYIVEAGSGYATGVSGTGHIGTPTITVV